MDLPGTVSHFALPRLRLSPPTTEKIAVAGLIMQRAEIDYSVKSLPEPVTSRHTLSLQPLLCTFLI